MVNRQGSIYGFDFIHFLFAVGPGKLGKPSGNSAVYDAASVIAPAMSYSSVDYSAFSRDYASASYEILRSYAE